MMWVPATHVAQTINNAGTYIIGILFYFGFQFIWRISISFAVASTKTYTIYWVILNRKLVFHRY